MVKVFKKIGDKIIHAEFSDDIPAKYYLNEGWIVKNIPEDIMKGKEPIIKNPQENETQEDHEKRKENFKPITPEIKEKRPRRTKAQILADQKHKK